MEQLTQVVGSEIDCEMGVALPNLRGIFEATDRQDELKTAGPLSTYATNLHPHRPRWRKRAPVISRLITVYDRLLDFPRGTVRR
jgi:hypothetical protein